MTYSKTTCPGCKLAKGHHKGRALDGRRAYRCQACGKTWTFGSQGRAPRYSRQRTGYQFADTGAANWAHRRSAAICSAASQ